eukprot:TRINITY_DN10148_c0_g1_i1.p1 TRINITY_DN10148_c0_g1~~TRINITY_DN10148_c0_g1_i1.p1  ORF type:complete len:264 (+),score=62.85 TRINITY_DN10148_c0_g1_i1:126-917(+)
MAKNDGGTMCGAGVGMFMVGILFLFLFPPLGAVIMVVGIILMIVGCVMEVAKSKEANQEGPIDGEGVVDDVEMYGVVTGESNNLEQPYYASPPPRAGGNYGDAHLPGPYSGAGAAPGPVFMRQESETEQNRQAHLAAENDAVKLQFAQYERDKYGLSEEALMAQQAQQHPYYAAVPPGQGGVQYVPPPTYEQQQQQYQHYQQQIQQQHDYQYDGVDQVDVNDDFVAARGDTTTTTTTTTSTTAAAAAGAMVGAAVMTDRKSVV